MSMCENCVSSVNCIGIFHHISYRKFLKLYTTNPFLDNLMMIILSTQSYPILISQSWGYYKENRCKADKPLSWYIILPTKYMLDVVVNILMIWRFSFSSKNKYEERLKFLNCFIITVKVSLQRLSRDVVVTLADRHYTVSWENGQNESGFLYDDIIN